MCYNRCNRYVLCEHTSTPTQAQMAPQIGFCIPVSSTAIYRIQHAPLFTDQLSETSAFIILATQPPETLTYPTAPT